MGLIQRWIEKRATNLQNPAQWLLAYARAGGESAAGEEITDKSALRVGAVIACVQIVAGTIASLPCHVYRSNVSGAPRKERLPDHPLVRLLGYMPNPRQDCFAFWESFLMQLELLGNAYAEKELTAGGQLKALWPLDAARMIPKIQGGQLVYEFRRGNGETVTLRQEKVFHVHLMSRDGLAGMSRLELAREAIGTSIAAEKYGGRFFANDATPGLALSHPAKLSSEAAGRLAETWRQTHGADNKGGIAVLEEDMKILTLGVPAKDAQFMELRQFEIGDIARIFGVKPHKIGDNSRSTFSNIESEQISWVQDDVRIRVTRLERAIQAQLLNDADFGRVYVKFEIDGLMRGDMASRFSAYSIAIQNGIYSPNECRDLEDRNPREGGDEFLSPLNMAPSPQGEDEPDPKSDPKAKADPAVDGDSKTRAAVSGREQRANGTQRATLRETFRPLWEDTAARIIHRESQAVEQAAKKYLAANNRHEFTKWLSSYYAEAPAWIREAVEPLARSCADAISRAAAAEVGQDVPDMGDSASEYARIFARDHAQFAENQLRKVVDEAPSEPMDGVDTAGAAIETRLAEWAVGVGESKSFAGKIALDESVRVDGVFTRETWERVGVTKQTWQANSNACPLCDHMNGRTVGIRQEFVGTGDTVGTMTVQSPVRNPPLHGGCTCSISAG